MTIVELLIAGFILVVVLGAAAAFLAQQTRLQRSVQTRNELQDRVRVAMQLVTQDLALVGNPILVSADGTQIIPSPFLGCPGSSDASLTAEERERERCLELVSVSPSSSVLRMRYVSSQFATDESCRDVTYQIDEGGTLERSDVPCKIDTWGTLDPIPIAPNTVEFKVVVVCSNGAVYDSAPTLLCSEDGYARSAIVSVAAESTASQFSATAEVLMPNLKE